MAGVRVKNCPICLGVDGIESEETLLKKDDLVYQDNLVSVFINSFWIKSVEGHAIVVTNDHIENIYEMPVETGAKVAEMTKAVAIAIKRSYKADGITIRQNNERAGDQHAMHYHQHIFPRYTADKFNESIARGSTLSAPDKRIPYANLLRSELSRTKISSS